MRRYTIGYGSRKPGDFLRLLQEHGVLAFVDVRLRPDRARMGVYAKAKDPSKGIDGLPGKTSIQYLSLVELGNIFLDFEDWEVKYCRLLNQAGDLLTERLPQVQVPFCLMCAEIAEYLAAKGWEVQNIEWRQTQPNKACFPGDFTFDDLGTFSSLPTHRTRPDTSTYFTLVPQI
jgi:hypothetical protein